MIEIELAGVRFDIPGNTPLMVLREVGPGERLLPIFIGDAEARAIQLALDEVELPRPMTHDLLRDVMGILGGALERVRITSVEEGTFYAELDIRTGDRVEMISARPSDALALAVRCGAPLFVAESVLEEAGLTTDESDGEDSVETGDVVEQFREFIDSVNPDDFLP